LGMIIAILSGIIVQVHHNETNLIRIYTLIVYCFISFFAAYKLIPSVATKNLNRGRLFGRDINKNIPDKIPESLGIAIGSVYVVTVILLQPFFIEKIGEYNAGLTSITFMLFLGFLDDVLDLRWRVKIFLSFLATLPILVAYAGPTDIIVPKPFRFILGHDVHLSFLYHSYMAIITVFCTNSINIYAGINGLEVSQSIVISVAVVIHNVIQLGGPSAPQHYLSLFLIFPFLSVSLALICYNWYPSRVFVGDSFTYFSGITLAVAGILGHFSKTLMLFFIPQLINFIISLPQLFRVIPCPRHRVPKFKEQTGLLYPSYTSYDDEGKPNGYPNLTVINAFIHLFGPTHERTLCFRLVIFQILCCSLGFAVRYSHAITNLFYDGEFELGRV